MSVATDAVLRILRGRESAIKGMNPFIGETKVAGRKEKEAKRADSKKFRWLEYRRKKQNYDEIGTYKDRAFERICHL